MRRGTDERLSSSPAGVTVARVGISQERVTDLRASEIVWGLTRQTNLKQRKRIRSVEEVCR